MFLGLVAAATGMDKLPNDLPDVFLRYRLCEGHELQGLTECPEGAVQIEIGIIADVWRNLATGLCEAPAQDEPRRAHSFKVQHR